MKKFYITIAREYGSGGRLVGQKLAEELGISFYDKELISNVAKEMGIDEDSQDPSESHTAFFFYNVYGYPDTHLPDVIYSAESNAIRSIAAKESAVFIGRNASNVLEDFDNVIRIFIHAPIEYRMDIAKRLYNDTEEEAKKKIDTIDGGRAEYTRLFSNKRWRDLRNYSLSINSEIGIDDTVDVAKSFINSYLNNVLQKD